MTQTCRVELVAASREHIAALIPRMRQKDCEEALNAGITVERAVWRSYRGSVFAKVALVNGEIAAVWGVCGTLGRTGQPWLFTTPVVERAKMHFVRIMRQEVKEMLVLYPRLLGLVDDAYAGAIRLLGAVGFKISEPFSYGRYGMPFREYSAERN